MAEENGFTEQHTITALVQDEPGTLNRLVSLFRRRGFNLASLNVGDCEVEGFSRLSLVVNGDETSLRQCVKQLIKLVEVVDARDIPARKAVQRELVLIKVNAPKDHRSEILEIIEVLGGKVAHITRESLTVEFTGEPSKIDSMISMLKPYGIAEIVRTGMVATRADDPVKEDILAAAEA